MKDKRKIRFVQLAKRINSGDILAFSLEGKPIESISRFRIEHAALQRRLEKSRRCPEKIKKVLDNQ